MPRLSSLAPSRTEGVHGKGQTLKIEEAVPMRNPVPSKKGRTQTQSPKGTPHARENAATNYVVASAFDVQ